MKGFILLLLAVFFSVILYPLGIVYSLITLRFFIQAVRFLLVCDGGKC